MGMFAKKVIEQAKAWLGKKESDGSHKEIIDVYNSHKPLARGYAVKYTDSWCATFVSAVAIKLGYTSIIPTECSCERMIALFKELGCFVEDENRKPNPGDIIFYDWQDSGKGDNKGWSDHVGIVENVSGAMMTVIEGNYSNEVKRRTLAVNGKSIRGYGVPKYDAEPVQQVNTTPTTTTTKTVETVAKEVLAGKWGNGAERKSRLESAGYDYAVIQAKVNQLSSSTSTKTTTTTSATYYPKYTGASGRVDEVLEAVGVSSSYYGNWKKRKPLATANGINNYTGTAAQNNKLISLAKNGKLKKV